MRFYYLLKIARPDSICWESREFCLAVIVIISSVVPALRVGDSKGVEDSALHFNLLGKRYVLSTVT